MSDRESFISERTNSSRGNVNDDTAPFDVGAFLSYLRAGYSDDAAANAAHVYGGGQGHSTQHYSYAAPDDDYADSSVNDYADNLALYYGDDGSRDAYDNDANVGARYKYDNGGK